MRQWGEAKSNHLYFRRSCFWINFNLKMEIYGNLFPAMRYDGKRSRRNLIKFITEEFRAREILEDEDSWCIQHRKRRCEKEENCYNLSSSEKICLEAPEKVVKLYAAALKCSERRNFLRWFYEDNDRRPYRFYLLCLCINII